ncbi:MAG: NAD(P)H-dependent flavin oxidoreductase [Thermodesulfobacteriota bacterium]
MGNRTLRTKLCDMLGIEYPVLSAGMGPALPHEESAAPVGLVVAVSEAGGCGVLGASAYTIEELRQHIREIKAQTSRPFGVDLLFPKNVYGERPGKDTPDEVPLSALLERMPKAHRDWIDKVRVELGLRDVEVMLKTRTTLMLPQEAVRVCLEEGVPLICSGLGDPGFMVEEAHAAGTKVLALTGNVKNAKRMAKSGVDLIVAQGYEGGGHTGRVGTMALIPQVIDAVEPIPVLAAGGIGDGRGLAGALAMGCVGVWVGTRFLATEEAGSLEANKKRIVEAADEDTVVSKVYSGKTLRAIRNRFHDLWDGSGLDPLPFPTQAFLSSALVAGFIEARKDDYVGVFAGQISGLIREIKPAQEVLWDMVEEAADILTRRLPESVIVR